MTTPKPKVMPYTGNKDASATAKATPGAIKFLEILGNKWGFTNLDGKLVVRTSNHRE